MYFAAPAVFLLHRSCLLGAIIIVKVKPLLAVLPITQTVSWLHWCGLLHTDFPLGFLLPGNACPTSMINKEDMSTSQDLIPVQFIWDRTEVIHRIKRASEFVVMFCNKIASFTACFACKDPDPPPRNRHGQNVSLHHDGKHLMVRPPKPVCNTEDVEDFGSATRHVSSFWT